MSVLLAVTVPRDSLEIGQATSVPVESHIELEQIVPTGDGVIPYFWADAPDFDSFEATVRAHESVSKLEVVTEVGGRRLYRIYWEEMGAFISALSESNATVLEGHGSDPWSFRLLFPTRAEVTEFRTLCEAKGISFDVKHVSELSKHVTPREFDLTEEQYESLRLAIDRGYFSIPRKTTLNELAATVGISQQAMSERIRRGTSKVLTQALGENSKPMDN